MRRPLARDTNRIIVPLPVPLAESVGTADLTVRGATGLELLPDIVHSVGLTPTPASDAASTMAMTAASSASAASCRKRFLLLSASSRSRNVATDVVAQVNMASRQAQVEERIDYTVRYEPIRELAFEMANDLSSDPRQTEIVLLHPGNATEPDSLASETLLSWVTPVERSEPTSSRTAQPDPHHTAPASAGKVCGPHSLPMSAARRE